MTIKVAYHPSYGGFSIPLVVGERLCELAGLDVDFYELSQTSACFYPDLHAEIKSRHDPRLIQAIEEFPKECAAYGVYLHTLKGNKYIIDEYDGWEEVKEPDDIEWIEVSDD